MKLPMADLTGPMYEQKNSWPKYGKTPEGDEN